MVTGCGYRVKSKGVVRGCSKRVWSQGVVRGRGHRVLFIPISNDVTYLASQW